MNQPPLNPLQKAVHNTTPPQGPLVKLHLYTRSARQLTKLRQKHSTQNTNMAVTQDNPCPAPNWTAKHHHQPLTHHTRSKETGNTPHISQRRTHNTLHDATYNAKRENNAKSNHPWPLTSPPITRQSFPTQKEKEQTNGKGDTTHTKKKPSTKEEQPASDRHKVVSQIIISTTGANKNRKVERTSNPPHTNNKQGTRHTQARHGTESQHPPKDKHNEVKVAHRQTQKTAPQTPKNHGSPITQMTTRHVRPHPLVTIRSWRPGYTMMKTKPATNQQQCTQEVSLTPNRTITRQKTNAKEKSPRRTVVSNTKQENKTKRNAESKKSQYERHKDEKSTKSDKTSPIDKKSEKSENSNRNKQDITRRRRYTYHKTP